MTTKYRLDYGAIRTAVSQAVEHGVLDLARARTKEVVLLLAWGGVVPMEAAEACWGQAHIYVAKLKKEFCAPTK